MANEGLLASLKNLATTLVSIIYTRLELLSTDLEEGRQRLLSLLVMTFISLFCLCMGVVMLAITLAVIFWDTHRLLALGMLTSLFLVSGIILSIMAIRALKTMPRMLQASLIELAKDQEALNANHNLTDE